MYYSLFYIFLALALLLFSRSNRQGVWSLYQRRTANPSVRTVEVGRDGWQH
jgi:hypothetical protein